MNKIRNVLILGVALIIIGIIIAILFQPDNISFIFAGIGIIIVGLAFLSYLNKPR